MEFKTRLRGFRQKLGLSQQKAAQAIGITTRQYQRFEAGEQLPGFENLIRLADLFEVTLDELVGRAAP